jgi:DNA-binding PadR family transcriptional regulator
MHGYQLMLEIDDRRGGRWTPSPGALYPTISQLEDEGLVTVTADSGRKLVALTDEGRAALEEGDPDRDPFFAGGEAEGGADLRQLLSQLVGAVREVSRNGTEEQRTAGAAILANARRSLYLLLAGDDHLPTP